MCYFIVHDWSFYLGLLEFGLFFVYFRGVSKIVKEFMISMRFVFTSFIICFR